MYMYILQGNFDLHYPKYSSALNTLHPLSCVSQFDNIHNFSDMIVEYISTNHIPIQILSCFSFQRV